MVCEESLRTAKGFTLIEVMIALSILGLVLTSVLRLHGQSIGLLDRASAEVQAPYLASEIMSRMIRELPDPGVLRGDFEHFPEFTWEAKVSPLEDMELGEENSRLFRVHVRLLRRGTVFLIRETIHGVLP